MSSTVEKVFDALSNPIRLKLYTLLLQHEMCVCELDDLFDVSQPAISQHLKVLQGDGLIESEERSQWTFYQACPNPLREACEMVLKENGDQWESLSEKAYKVKRDHLRSLRDKEPKNSSSNGKPVDAKNGQR